MTPEAERGERADTAPVARPVPPVPGAAPTVPRAPRAAADAPTRPALGGEGFAATLDVGPPPTALVASVTLWLSSAVLALVAAVLLWRDRAGVRAGLRDSVVEQDPAAPADVVAEAAGWAFTAGTGSLALLGVLLALLARPLRRGRAWARPLLLLSGLVGVVVAVVVQDLVQSPGRLLLDDPVRVALLAIVPLVVAAAATMLLPGPRAWLRRVQARTG